MGIYEVTKVDILTFFKYLDCSISGYSQRSLTDTLPGMVFRPAVIKWNYVLQPSKFFRMTYDDDHIARLVIAGAYPEDDGVYVCTASNSSGSETSSCHLFVKGKLGENYHIIKIHYTWLLGVVDGSQSW